MQAWIVHSPDPEPALLGWPPSQHLITTLVELDLLPAAETAGALPERSAEEQLVVDGRYAWIDAEDLAPLLGSTPTARRLLDAEGRMIAARSHRPRGCLDRPESAGPSLQMDRALRIDGPESRARVARVLQERILRRHQRSGVYFVDPQRVVVEAEVQLAPGVRIWPDVVLRGNSRIAEGSEVQAGCWLEGTEVGPRCLLKPHSVCTDARIGAECAVGPMAHLRPGAILARDVKVGNFVEVKKSRLQQGVRASHLSYLGDAEVGEGANIGAGTITCNYDGVRKHRTEIGRGAFIGSNTSLVAPVRVGERAVTAASSAITRDVPDEALVVERAQLRVLRGKGAALMRRNRTLAASED